MKSGNSPAISENGSKGNLSVSSIRSLLSRSISTKHKSPLRNSKIPKSGAENTPPLDPNIPDSDAIVPSPKLGKPSETVRSEGQEAPSNPQPSTKVAVRIRPANEFERLGDQIVKKLSSNSLSVGDRKFTFDSVFDASSSQEHIFQTVGVPLVQSALAGYNTSILTYGQSGSGKTYTMWGPPSSIVEEPSSRSAQGLVPRIFQMLFSEIEKEQGNSEGKLVNYQCRCSFLEIYNEQIGDLLDPTQRNLKIKDDLKNGLYVENLTEEYVTGSEEITQILIKGLSNRKVGATSLNSKSSRSHIVLTCIIESWCKESSSKCFSSSKTSRISLVDLAGSDRNKLDDAGRQCVREARNVKKSLSQLGYLVDSLAKRSQGGDKGVPYKASCLTHLLRESFGGNSKLTVICAISPDKRSESEIVSTLRLGQRVKYIKNEPVINEISEDDVNDLSDQIRQLKEELIRTRSLAHNSMGSKQKYFHGQTARESLNQLRVSLNRSLILPRIDCEKEDDINVHENDVRELCKELDKLETCENQPKDSSQKGNSTLSSCTEECCQTDLSEEYSNCPEEFESEDTNSRQSESELAPEDSIASADDFVSCSRDNLSFADRTVRTSISISSYHRSPILEDPTLTESPKIQKSLRRSIAISSSLLASQKNIVESEKFLPDVPGKSLRQSQHLRSSLQSSKLFPGPTESLAASLHRGLEIIDYHEKNSAANKSSTAFSFEHLTLKPSPEVDRANTSAQTSPEESQYLDGPYGSFLCASCQRKRSNLDCNEVQDSLKTWKVASDGGGNPKNLKAGTAKDVEIDVSADVKRTTELEKICKEQAAKIELLNSLVEQYKIKKERNSIDALKKEIIPYDELHSQNSKDLQLLTCEEVRNDQAEEKCEIKEVQEEQHHGDEEDVFDMNEKEALLKEIHLLRSKLESYTDACPDKSTEKLRSSLLLRSIQLRKSCVGSQHNEEEIERERQRWTEMESEWISLTDELRVAIETNRRRAEKLDMELRLEKNCTEELDDALQRSVLGHARMVEHYTELQEKYNDLAAKHHAIMEGIAEVKRAAAKAGAKGNGSRFAKSLAAELSALRVERERERELLKKENKRLKIQLRDTADAVHAAGELLVRLREAEQSTSAAEENVATVQEENEKLRKQLEKLKRKHKMEMITMKQYLAESRLPQSALQSLHRGDSDIATTTDYDDDLAWRAEFGATYQGHY
ncbi:Kinesin motor domain-containing protein [Psidium guajava]|nr:Kinesin motor domain-containing protein [Psidium guajava]